MPNNNLPPLPQHIDSTMLTCFRSCPQKFALEFIHGYALPGVSIDLHAGACFASALEETYRGVWRDGKSLSDALLVAQARFFTEWGDVEPPIWKRTAKTKDRVWDAVESYFTLYTPLTDHAKPYTASDGQPTLEYTFAIPLEPTAQEGFPEHPSGSPFIYCGRFDMLAEYLGRPTPKDDKTTGYGIGNNWASQWALRNQFIGYVWACRQCGLDTQNLIVRGTSIQKTQIDHAEAVIPYSDHLMAKWYEQLRRDLWRIRRAYDSGYFDYNLGDTCTSYGLCAFIDSCASPSPDNWLANFEKRTWNPLLKNPTAVGTTQW